MDKCREEFESYLLNNGYSKDALHKSQYCDYYSRSFTRELWKAWQKAWLASRESMKAIKLPELDDYYLTPKYDSECHEIQRFDCDAYQDSIADAITSAGYKVE